MNVSLEGIPLQENKKARFVLFVKKIVDNPMELHEQ